MLLPNLRLKSIDMIDIQMLKQKGIKALVLDVDNTLTTHGSQEISETVKIFLQKLKQNDIKLMIVSNNNDARVKPFAQKIGLDYVSMALKPLTVGLSKAQKKFNLSKNEIAMVGDQLFTDVWAGSLKGFYTILLEPIKLETGAFFKFKRQLEKLFLKY